MNSTAAKTGSGSGSPTRTSRSSLCITPCATTRRRARGNPPAARSLYSATMRTLWLLVAAATLASVVPVAAHADSERLLRPDGAPMFLIALNYEGPADRAWQMWDNGKFDAARIDADFARASAAGARALRIFLQAALATDIAGGKWDKL